MTWQDPVAMIRAALAAHDPVLETTRVLEPRFTEGQMPMVHVHHRGGVLDEYDRTDQIALDVYAPTPTAEEAEAGVLGAGGLAAALMGVLVPGPLYTQAGTVDEISCSAPVTRPYHQDVEVASMVLDVVHRPTH